MDIKTALQQHPFETKGKPGSELIVGTVLDLPPGVVNFEVLRKKNGTEPINRRLAELLEGKVKLVIRSSNFNVSRPCQDPRNAQFSTGENPKLLTKDGYWRPPSISYKCQASKESAALCQQGTRTTKLSQCKFLVEFKKHQNKKACKKDKTHHHPPLHPPLRHRRALLQHPPLRYRRARLLRPPHFRSASMWLMHVSMSNQTTKGF